MPGVFQMSVDVAGEWLAARAEQGFGAYLVFGESLTAGQITGGAIVLASLTLVLLGHRPRSITPSPLEGE